MICISIFNASFGVIMINPEFFMQYWVYNPKYAVVFTLIIISCFFTDVVVCMLFSWLLFFVMYMQSGKDGELYKIGDLVSVRRAIETFELTHRKHYPKPENAKNTAEESKDLDDSDRLITEEMTPGQQLLRIID